MDIKIVVKILHLNIELNLILDQYIYIYYASVMHGLMSEELSSTHDLIQWRE